MRPPSSTQALTVGYTAGIPAVVGQQPEFIDAGGIIGFGYVIDYVTFAQYADRILKGTRAGDLPIAASTSSELMVNLNTAEALGLTVSPSVVARATRVIK